MNHFIESHSNSCLPVDYSN